MVKNLQDHFERFVLDAGTLDDSDNFVDNLIYKEPDGTTAITDEIKSVCNADGLLL